MNTEFELTSIIRNMEGTHYDEARQFIEQMDWRTFYPVVDKKGFLTGQVIDGNDPIDYIIVDIVDGVLVESTDI